MTAEITELPALHPNFSTPAEMLSGDRRWYIAMTQGGHEKKFAATALATDTPYFLPLATETRHRNSSGQRYKVQVPVFPNYCFFAADPDERVKLLAAWLIKGLRPPAQIPVSYQSRLTSELESIHIVTNAGNFTVVAPPTVAPRRLEEGEIRYIKAGPYMGARGYVVEYHARKARVTIGLIDTASYVAVEVDVADLAER